MRRNATKKGTEWRKKSRERTSSSKAQNSQSSKNSEASYVLEPGRDTCFYCAKSLKDENERALFVEEEVGRIFCSEDCITAYFAPEIERLEKEYFRRLSPNDLSQKEREGLAHLRWITLQEPDEVWREKTLKGDYRYTLISEFKPGEKKIWSIAICLFLRGEPSFLFLAFATRNSAMLNQYRRGERVEWVKPSQDSDVREAAAAAVASATAEGSKTDRLADDWTEDETFRAQMLQARSGTDIPVKDFPLYEDCLESTLEEPDEVWSMSSDEEDQDSPRIFHFLRYYAERQDKPAFWYVIITRETEEDEQMEVLDAFPTRDSHLVERYRHGTQEVGQENNAAKAAARMVH